MKGKHCLVYWLSAKQITVLLTKDIPAKKRQENVPIKLLWKDVETNKTTAWDAKILRFDDDPAFLNSLLVDEDTGTIIGPKDEEITKNVGKKREQLQEDAREEKKPRPANYEPPQEDCQQSSISYTFSPIPAISPMINVNVENSDRGEPSTQKEPPTKREMEQVTSTSSAIPLAEAPLMEHTKEQSCRQESDSIKPEETKASEGSEDSEESGDSENSDESEESYDESSDEDSPFPGLRPPTLEFVQYFKALAQRLEIMAKLQKNKTRVKKSSID